MKIEEHETEVDIILTDSTGVRGKALFSFEALSALGGIVAMLAATVAAIREKGIVLSVFTVAFAVVFFIAMKKYLSRITLREQLIIGSRTICHIRIANGNKTLHNYEAQQIINLRFTGFIKPIDHPLKSQTFDYLGFQTQQQVVNSATTEGNLAFEYDGTTVSFGVGVPSWDAALLNDIIKARTGNILSIANLPEEIPENVWNQP